MRGKSSSKQVKEREMEIENLKEEEPHLSGAYIRSLVKQLSHNSRNKESLNTPKSDEDVTIDTNGNETQQPQQHKKQVRRRLHITRPYQERLLNMAEARREIVTALKFHRASMKQQQQQQQPKPQMDELVKQLQPSLPLDGQHQGKPKSRRNPNNHEPNNTKYFESFSASNFSYYPPPYNTYSVQENFDDFSLPSQALGLNLNLQDFNNLATSIYNSGSYLSVYSSSSASLSSSPPTSYSAESCFPILSASEEGSSSMVADYMDFQQEEIDMHPRMDDKEIAAIRSIGDQHQMELNDTLNLVSSAWWAKFLKSMESYGNVPKTEDEYGRHPFDEIAEFPAWLNGNDSCLQQHLQDYYSDDYFKDPSLPCMDIIDQIQGMDDGEWLSSYGV